MVRPSIFSIACTSRGLEPATLNPSAHVYLCDKPRQFHPVLADCRKKAHSCNTAESLPLTNSMLYKYNGAYRIPIVKHHPYSYLCCEYGIPFPCTSKLMISFSDSFCERFIVDTLRSMRRKEGKFDWRTTFPSIFIVFSTKIFFMDSMYYILIKVQQADIARIVENPRQSIS